MGMVGTAEPWQLEFETVEERCGYLLTSGLWTDCTFIVGPTKQAVRAHKLILSMASPVFEKMFYGEPSVDMPADEPIIYIPDVQPEAFKALFPYIYTGNINIRSLDMALDLWKGAKTYMLPYLVDECNRYILSVVNPNNACRVYEFSRLFEEKTLADKCIEIITTYTEEVLNASGFEEVEINTLITVLSLDHLNVESELDLFYAVEKYVKAEQKRRQKEISSEDGGQPSEKLSDEKVLVNENTQGTSQPATGELNLKEGVSEKPTIRNALQKIRFLTLTPQQFAEGPARSELLTKEESLALLMNIASESAGPMPTGFSGSRERRQPRE